MPHTLMVNRTGAMSWSRAGFLQPHSAIWRRTDRYSAMDELQSFLACSRLSSTGTDDGAGTDPSRRMPEVGYVSPSPTEGRGVGLIA